MRSRAERLEAGFTLLEVLIAMCIIAIAFGAIWKAQAQGISMTGEAREITTAGLLAQMRMSDSLAMTPEWGLRRGDFGKDYPGFWWEEGVTSYKEFGAETRKVRLTVFWGPGDSARRLVLESYLLEPAADANDETGDSEDQGDEAKKAETGKTPKTPKKGGEEE